MYCCVEVEIDVVFYLCGDDVGIDCDFVVDCVYYVFDFYFVVCVD